MTREDQYLISVENALANCSPISRSDFHGAELILVI